mmetsp:Transcript_27486/g.58068  ORF Transcript_27486/g.58068 Transcript_27486/m.58068 type:complete len:535 (+) Transcript_27486:232-1836(+)
MTAGDEQEQASDEEEGSNESSDSKQTCERQIMDDATASKFEEKMREVSAHQVSVVDDSNAASASAASAPAMRQGVNPAPPITGMTAGQPSLLSNFLAAAAATPPASAASAANATASAASLNNIAPLLTQLSSLSQLPLLVGHPQSMQPQVQPPAQIQIQAPSLFAPLPNQTGLAGATQMTPAPSQPSLAQQSLQGQAQLQASIQAALLQPGFLNSFQSLPLSQLTSLIGQVSSSLAGSNQMPQALAPSTQPEPLMGQLAQTNIGGLSQGLSAPTAAPSSLQASTLGQQLAAAQVQQTSQLPVAQPPALDNSLANLFQSLSAPQTPTSIPTNPQSQSNLVRVLIQDSIIKDQIISHLLSQQQTEAQNYYTRVAQLTATANQLNSLSQGAAQYLAQIPEISSQGTTSAAVSERTSSSQQQSATENTSSSDISGCAGSGNDVDQHALSLSASPDLASRDRRWMLRYQELKQYQQQHGNCRVPHGYAKNRKLSWWVMNLRAQLQLLKQGKKNWLTDERIALLDEIGFEWNPVLAKSEV